MTQQRYEEQKAQRSVGKPRGGNGAPQSILLDVDHDGIPDDARYDVFGIPIEPPEPFKNGFQAAGPVLDVVEHERQVAAVRVEWVLGKCHTLRLTHDGRATDVGFRVDLNVTERLCQMMQYGIEIR
jgi:hypothetical protein